MSSRELFCENGHEWVSVTVRGGYHDGGYFREPDEDSDPSCPECSCDGYESVQEARREAGDWSACPSCGVLAFHAQGGDICDNCEYTLGEDH